MTSQPAPFPLALQKGHDDIAATLAHRQSLRFGRRPDLNNAIGRMRGLPPGMRVEHQEKSIQTARFLQRSPGAWHHAFCVAKV